MADPKVVNLTIGERLAAIKLFDVFKGSMLAFRALLEDVKQFAVTDEEWTEASLVKNALPDGTENWKWTDTGTKEITLQPETLKYLVDSIKAKSDAGDISIADVALSTLEPKLAA